MRHAKRQEPFHAVGMDIGGTSVSAALVSATGDVVTRDEWEIDSNGSRSHILEVVTSAVQFGLGAASDRGTPVVGIGIGVPGPFEYDAGIHRATHKFGSITGVPLREVIRAGATVGEDVPIRFLHDIHAFLLGEYWTGKAREHDRVMTINIGTGLGVGYARGGVLLHNGSGGPWRSIYAMPYGESILEDYVSRRGIIREYRSQLGMGCGERSSDCIDVHEIAVRARSGDASARVAFERTGRALAAAVSPIVEEFEPECIIFCGRISLAFDLFGEPFRHALPHDREAPQVVRSDDPPTSALIGAAYYVLAENLRAPADLCGNAPSLRVR